VHGGCADALDAIVAENLDSSSLTAGEQALLSFARKVNLDSHNINRKDVDLLMQREWSEPQVAEAVHVAALFSTFNRVANAFGLASQGLLSVCGAHTGEEQGVDLNLERTPQ
jgi:alkylhydroperoxidase family enzyme